MDTEDIANASLERSWITLIENFGLNQIEKCRVSYCNEKPVQFKRKENAQLN
jgi:hypothetical protein